MSKSLRRVAGALAEAGLDISPMEMPGSTRTAQDAADAVGCHIDQIAKSIIFLGETSGQASLFITAGGNQVDVTKARDVAGEPLGKADAALIRAQTGFCNWRRRPNRPPHDARSLLGSAPVKLRCRLRRRRHPAPHFPDCAGHLAGRVGCDRGEIYRIIRPRRCEIRGQLHSKPPYLAMMLASNHD
jgi:hypothetical protein